MVTSNKDNEVEDAREMVSGVDKTGAVSSTMSSVGKTGAVSMTLFTWLFIAINAIVSGLHTDDYIVSITILSLDNIRLIQQLQSASWLVTLCNQIRSRR
jgi:hypothetical protein